jgi:hypothetical protein
MNFLYKVLALCLLSNVISSNALGLERDSLYNNEGYENYFDSAEEDDDKDLLIRKRDAPTSEASSGWHYPWQYKPSDFSGMY